MTKILGVSGSMRQRSYGARALNLVLEAAKEKGALTRLLDLRTADLPIYRPGGKKDAPGVVAAIDAVRWADALVLAAPDYHGTMSGSMKNFLDYFWTDFSGKLFGYIVASHEKGLTVMDEMRTAVRQCYGWSLPYGVSVHGEKDFDQAEGEVDERIERRLRMLARDMVVYGGLIREQFQLDLESEDLDTFVAKYRAKKE